MNKALIGRLCSMYSHGLHRAKKKDGNEWVIGYYIYCEGKHFIKNGDMLNDGWHEVNEDTLGMYCEINDVIPISFAL